MNLLAVFVGNNWTLCGSCISAENDTVLENDTDNGGACFDGLRHGHTLTFQHCIAKKNIKCIILALSCNEVMFGDCDTATSRIIILYLI